MAEEKQEEKDFTMDEAAMERLLTEAEFVRRGRSVIVEIEGKKWRMRPTSQAQNQIMANLDFDVMYWQKKLKEGNLSRRKAKRISTRIRKAYAKKAAHKVLGLKLRWVPLLFMILWRRIY
ncbi:MAG: hypothetical protein K2N25_04500, partial [Muribaculaceae bacterium]|nr:hypothetical protein [Muribaculaceae bacterium]